MAINDIINDQWQGHTHGEVEVALKDKLQELADLANTALQSETDPSVPTHVKGITQADINNWNGKADQATTYSKSDVDNLISNLIDGAPETLDTLRELAAALGDNGDAIDALTAAIAAKINGIKVNGTLQTPDEQGNVDITIEGGEVDIVDNLSTNDGAKALSAKQGKVLNESKQDTLVSGTNIKTVNNQSLLGSGNITVQGEKGDKGDKGDTVVLDPEGLEQFDIINDTSTGGASDALSAEMGKRLAGQIASLEDAVEDIEGGSNEISVVGDAIVINSLNNPRVNVGSVGNDSLSAKVGNTATTSFYVSGRKLTSAIQISVSDLTNWRVSPASISPVNGKVEQTLVTITYQPASGSTAGTPQPCTVTISSTGAQPSTIEMTGTVATSPTITLTPPTLNISADEGTPATGTINVKGAALEGDISLAVSGTAFTLSPNSVDKDLAKTSEGVNVTITFDGSAAASETITATTADGSGTATATATVTGTINLSFIATMDYVIRTGGNVESRTGAFYSSTIPMSAGQTLVFNGHANTNTAAIAIKNGTSYTMAVKGGTTANLTAYTYTAVADCEVAISGWSTYGDESASLDGVAIPINGLNPSSSNS